MTQPTATAPTYHSDARPAFAPFVQSCGSIVGFQYAGDLRSELDAGTLTAGEAERPLRSRAGSPSARS